VIRILIAAALLACIAEAGSAALLAGATKPAGLAGVTSSVRHGYPSNLGP
jgi:hypothetical protein